ncbi:hypothetical protein NEFER03_0430 [Nematocida sp. LUAm3]|nr:hypothetical protein NEFER03_0430 [Nematocida sp. LUAm3]KAI5175888.1 hypothetical protein NEFER02_1748 [Nematocida sp. LUAm2]KAI5178730.1 hypothetical protein NEFER01_1849 [Nematocida sp. LUAm1]
MHVCITGGSDGLGKELSKCFLSHQWRVTVIDRKPPKLFSTYIHHDFSSPLPTRISCDILIVNHAYFHGFLPFSDIKYVEVERYLNTHITSVVHLVKTSNYSKLVYINSVLSITAFPNTSLYSSAKAFMHTFLHALRREGLPVLIVYPYKLNTSLFSSVRSPYTLSVKDTASAIYHASLSNRSTIYIPWIFRISYILSILPLFLQDLLIYAIHALTMRTP